ncbi:hypothetical protein BV25DRAFT_1507948 [Artomyces pyxidatus]|uniref:Uncharacterized protein n=1 Tax=Artomyces pyxidatus TaxID=48021 RepID=A0ACB8TDB8_9AGAM|nr:hypothetical protein BV25DRAFT_1507948 [Artomyces pyxidatus]
MTSSYMSSADDSSDIFSLYSYAPMTRATSVEGSDALPTPLDPCGSRYPQKQQLSGPRSMTSRKEGTLVRHYSEASDAARSRYTDRTLDIVPEVQEYMQDSMSGYGPEPYEEYFSIPVTRTDIAPRTSSLQRHRSTKELINRFESMTSESAESPPKSPSAVPAPLLPTNTPHVTQGLFTPPTKTEKKSSPLRQSFRNLISVFKKGKKTPKEKVDPFSTLPKLKISTADESDLLSVDPFLVHQAHPGGSHKPTSGGTGSRICASPTYALQSGALLHLVRPSPTSTTILPIWTSCHAVLHTTHILLTSPTSQGVSSTDVVSLGACTDVRSLTTTEMDPEEQALMPAMEGGDQPRVFELSFAGKDPQRFAAASVKDRAAW